MSAMYSQPVGFNFSDIRSELHLSVADVLFTFVNHGTLCVLPEAELLLPVDYISGKYNAFRYAYSSLLHE